MSDIIFRADSIRRSFGGRVILNAATLWARAGEVTLMLGRNGCGKSTLFRIAAGLLRADQGVVLFGGQAYQRATLHELSARGLFYLPERGLLVRNLTIGDMLQLVTRRFGTSRDAGAVIDRMRLQPLLERRPDMLSGGEQRRCEVAIAMARRPTLLIADEPLMGQAPLDAALIAHALRDLARTGCAVVVSGHEVPELMAVADEVVWLAAGTTHGLGSPAQARAHWQFRQEYLGA
jgi:lipopolysaccharide export system ATP-binding protein